MHFPALATSDDEGNLETLSVLTATPNNIKNKIIQHQGGAMHFSTNTIPLSHPSPPRPMAFRTETDSRELISNHQ